MSSLHLWFSKLKWSMDVLVRFYERHAFICALHKVTTPPLGWKLLSCSQSQIANLACDWLPEHKESIRSQVSSLTQLLT